MGDDSEYIYLLGPNMGGFPYAWNWNNISLKLYNGSGKFHGRLTFKDLEVCKTQCLEARKPDLISPGNQSLRFLKKTVSSNCDSFLSLVQSSLSFIAVCLFCSFLFGLGLFPPLGYSPSFLLRSHWDRQFPDWHRGLSTQSPNAGWGQGSTVRTGFFVCRSMFHM